MAALLYGRWTFITSAKEVMFYSAFHSLFDASQNTMLVSGVRC